MFKSLKYNLSYIIIIFTFYGFAQNEAANWYFGQNASLNFNSGFPVAQLNSEMVSDEGCSSISDSRGHLLFYSDGITVWNKNHLVMQNGTGLFGDVSSTQSALIVPKPEDENIYYIFTVDDLAGDKGLRYSEIDITLAIGLGAVTSNKNIPLASSSTEKITAIESSDGLSIWVIAHKFNSDEFMSFLVTNTGVNLTPVISSIGSEHEGHINNTIGYLKASPNREKVVSVMSYANKEVQVFDFDATNGVLSNPITILNYNSINIGPYGCEFSPDSNLLYISEIDRDNTSKIHQYDLTQSTQQAIIDSDIIIAEEEEEFAALQQAIDGRIYVAIKNSTYLGVIENPNDIGISSNFVFEGVYLGGRISRFGLPPFIQSYFFATNIFRNTCFGDTTEFSIDTSTTIDSILWDFGDPASGINNTSTLLEPTHVFTTIGEYDITITIQAEGETQVVFRTLNISDQPLPLNLDPLSSCEINDDIAEFDLQSAIPQEIEDDPDILISYFETFIDAENSTNSIINVAAYLNITSPQIVYVRLQNNLRGDCFSISELSLLVIESIEFEETETVSFCENSQDDFAIIDVGELPGNLNDYSFLWLDTQETTSEIQVTNTGVFTVSITPHSSITTDNPIGCSVDRIVTVISSGIAIINTIEITSSSSVSIIVTGLGNYEYALDNINGPYQISNSFYDIEAGLHTVFVRDLNDCGISEDLFSLIGFPSYFTPNNDGYNDKWIVKGLSSQFQPNSKILIFDRYGKLLKQLDPLGEGWDGTFNGNILPSSDYWFSVTLQDGRNFINHFTLKR